MCCGSSLFVIGFCKQFQQLPKAEQFPSDHPHTPPLVPLCQWIHPPVLEFHQYSQLYKMCLTFHCFMDSDGKFIMYTWLTEQPCMIAVTARPNLLLRCAVFKGALHTIHTIHRNKSSSPDVITFVCICIFCKCTPLSCDSRLLLFQLSEVRTPRYTGHSVWHGLLAIIIRLLYKTHPEMRPLAIPYTDQYCMVAPN